MDASLAQTLEATQLIRKTSEDTHLLGKKLLSQKHAHLVVKGIKNNILLIFSVMIYEYTLFENEY